MNFAGVIRRECSAGLQSAGSFLLGLNRPTLYFAVALVPLTYVSTSLKYGEPKKAVSLRNGAWRHALLQSIAWAFWLSSLWLTVVQWLHRTPIPSVLPWQLTHVTDEGWARDSLPGLSAVLAVFAQLFMSQAGFVLSAQHGVAGGSTRRLLGRDGGTQRFAAGGVLALGFVWACIGFGLVLASEHLRDDTSRLLYYILALSATVVGAFSTHGLGGQLWNSTHKRTLPPTPLGHATHTLHSSFASIQEASLIESLSLNVGTNPTAASLALSQNGSASASDILNDGPLPSEQQHGDRHLVVQRARSASAALYCDVPKTTDSNTNITPPHSPTVAQRVALQGWSFYQPFRGGPLFVATQGAAWALFASCLVSFGWAIWAAMRNVVYCVKCWMLCTGVTMFVAQLLLAVSLFLFQGGAAATRKAAAATGRHWVHIWAPIIVIYTPLHTYLAVMTIACLVFQPPLVIAASVLIHALRVTWTAPSKPANTGAFRSAVFCNWLTKHLEGALKAWFGTFDVIRDTTAPPDPKRRYVIGYHPHGLFPAGAGYLGLLPSWRKLMPGIEPVTLTASVIFAPPVIRDIALATGLRQATRKAFVGTLQERGSVVIVPGGQAELVHTWRHQRSEFVTYRRHKGFVRLAAQHGASLIPVLAFGEVDSLRNLVNVPSMLQWTYKRFGFPMPYLMVGRWWLSPFPAKCGLRFIIGKPISLADAQNARRLRAAVSAPAALLKHVPHQHCQRAEVCTDTAHTSSTQPQHSRGDARSGVCQHSESAEGSDSGSMVGGEVRGGEGREALQQPVADVVFSVSRGGRSPAMPQCHAIGENQPCTETTGQTGHGSSSGGMAVAQGLGGCGADRNDAVEENKNCAQCSSLQLKSSSGLCEGLQYLTSCTQQHDESKCPSNSAAQAVARLADNSAACAPDVNGSGCGSSQKTNSAAHIEVSEEQVDALHDLYYAEVKRLFHKYQNKFPGYECLCYVEEN